MSKHTAEPWEVLEAEDDKNYLRIRGTVWGARYKIANVVWPRHSTSAQKLEEKETLANATRIVECVNACVGMADPSEDIATLKRQREQLLAALVNMILFSKHTKTNAIALNHATSLVSEIKSGAS